MRPQDVFNLALTRLGFSLPEMQGTFSQMLPAEQTPSRARGYLARGAFTSISVKTKGGNMQSGTKQFALEAASEQAINFHVLPISHCFFCVYADTALVDIYADRLSADDLCQRLRYQQAQGQAVRHGQRTMNDRYHAS
jgi:hypothetical protein